MLTSSLRPRAKWESNPTSLMPPGCYPGIARSMLLQHTKLVSTLLKFAGMCWNRTNLVTLYQRAASPDANILYRRSIVLRRTTLPTSGHFAQNWKGLSQRQSIIFSAPTGQLLQMTFYPLIWSVGFLSTVAPNQSQATCGFSAQSVLLTP